VRRRVVRPKICRARRVHAHSRDIDPAREDKLKPRERVSAGRSSARAIAAERGGEFVGDTIRVSPTEIVEPLFAPCVKSTGAVGSGTFVVPPGRKFGISQGSPITHGPGGGEVVVGPPITGIQKEASTVLPSSPARAGALAIANIAAAAAIKALKRNVSPQAHPLSRRAP
jgi:hypothetical protein